MYVMVCIGIYVVAAKRVKRKRVMEIIREKRRTINTYKMCCTSDAI
jgi:hypothetical protein